MEMMRNPNAMQQAMRSQDLAMSQIENLPGGFNALRRMYEEVSTLEYPHLLANNRFLRFFLLLYLSNILSVNLIFFVFFT